MERLERGQKLKLKSIDTFAEVQSCFPSGQAGTNEDTYEILFNGIGFRLTETVIGKLFEVLSSDPELAENEQSAIEEILEEEDAPEEVEEEAAEPEEEPAEEPKEKPAKKSTKKGGK